MAASDTTLLPGQQIGDYRILHLIGRGGMAEVYAADQPTMNRRVAVKLILAKMEGQSNLAQRFQREARVLATLEHPHILPVFDSGFAENMGRSYIVMRLIEEGTLENLILDHRDGLPVPQVRFIVERICDAMDYVHSHASSIVHRDLKPSNILIDKRGNPYITDFGIAKAMLTQEQSFTTTEGSLLGTPAYMSPEQLRSEDVDWRSDIYSLGMITYEALMGELPVKADNPYNFLFKYAHEDLPMAQQITPRFGAALGEVMQRVCARNVNERYQSANEFAIDFLKALSGGMERPITQEPTHPKRPEELNDAKPKPQEALPVTTIVAAENRTPSPDAAAQEEPTQPLGVVEITGEGGGGGGEAASDLWMTDTVIAPEVKQIKPRPVAPEVLQNLVDVAPFDMPMVRPAAPEPKVEELRPKTPTPPKVFIADGEPDVPIQTWPLRGPEAEKPAEPEPPPKPPVVNPSINRIESPVRPDEFAGVLTPPPFQTPYHPDAQKHFTLKRGMTDPEIPFVCPHQGYYGDYPVKVPIQGKPFSTQTIYFSNKYGKAYNAISPQYIGALIGCLLLEAAAGYLLGVPGLILGACGVLFILDGLNNLRSEDSRIARKAIRIWWRDGRLEYKVARTAWAQAFYEKNDALIER